MKFRALPPTIILMFLGRRGSAFLAPAALTSSQRAFHSIARAVALGSEQSLDPQLIVKDPETVIKNLKARRAGEDSIKAVDTIRDLMGTRSELIRRKEQALGSRKTLSAQIGKMMKEGDSEGAEKLKKEVEAANAIADEADLLQSGVDLEINNLFMRLPNLLDSRVPDGADEEENELVGEWGMDLVKRGEEYLWHDEIASALGGYDPEGAVRIAGARFAMLKGPLARLERALGQWFLDLHTSQHGYTEVSVPLLASRSTLEGTGQLPKFEDDLFKTNHEVGGEDSFLIPTAEVPLCGQMRDQILEQEELPLSFIALTPCFRAEAGSAGRDTRGLLRQHQFLKAELVKVTAADASNDEHEALTEHAEAVLKALKLPYRKVRLCSGDIGFTARMCYDLEVWMPGQQAFREISSCSNCGNFQARRMGLRYRAQPQEQPQGEEKKGKAKKAKKGKITTCHTINGSGVAVGRALVAVLENYYNPEDGSVTVPEVLRPYMSGVEKLSP
ncbi:unnamed protein product [Chrysoparadoxa australica]